MPKALAKTNGYATLLNKVRKTLIEGQQRIEQERVRTYWATGRVIHADILKHKDRAEYGAEVLKHLADDLDIKVRLLQYCVQFAKVYPRLPIVHRGAQFNWSHYRRFITVADDRERSLLEKKALENDWSVQELAARIRKERPVSPADDGTPVAQLQFTRGRLHTYQIVPANKSQLKNGPLALDLGFRLQAALPQGASKCKDGDMVELVFGKGDAVTAKRTEGAKDELFTYQAGVERIIDGDTLLVSFGFPTPMSISQKLRLRGIDCQELDTEEGKKAKRFVESRLKGCDFIIVKTYKDTTDRYDRYLADIFFAPGETDAAKITGEGAYLNQELLDERLALPY